MSRRYEVVTITGLTAISELEALGADVDTAASRAINRTLDRTRTRAARQIQGEVAFPPSYLAPSNKRLRVKSQANAANLEGVIGSMDVPTSLARFIKGSPRRGRGVTVQVDPGRVQTLPRAFTVKLNTSADTTGNLGLAIRLPAGRRPARSSKAREIARGLWLLYGPSVGQSFGVIREAIVPEAQSFLEAEFLRQIDLLGKKR